MKVWIAIGLFVAPTPLLLLGCSFSPWFTSSTTVPAVERQVDAALPVGSTRPQIEAWLSQQGIEHSFSDLPFLDKQGSNSVPDADYSGVVQGIIRDTDRTPLVRGSIRLQFILDKEGRLKRRCVTWTGTGL